MQVFLIQAYFGLLMLQMDYILIILIQFIGQNKIWLNMIVVTELITTNKINKDIMTLDDNQAFKL